MGGLYAFLIVFVKHIIFIYLISLVIKGKY